MLSLSKIPIIFFPYNCRLVILKCSVETLGRYKYLKQWRKKINVTPNLLPACTRARLRFCAMLQNGSKICRFKKPVSVVRRKIEINFFDYLSLSRAVYKEHII